MPKIVEYIGIIFISVVISIFACAMLFTTEATVWKKVAYENIYKAGKLEEQQVKFQNDVTNLVTDLREIRSITKVDSILKKHGL